MSLFCRTDVTAVKLTNSLILVGVGSYINIFDEKSMRLLCRRLVLKGQKIYGIVPKDESSLEILIFGGKQFRIILLDKSVNYTNFSFVFDTINCNDWLHSAIWAGTEEIALLTAHNVLRKWNIRTRETTTKYFSKYNSILYSGLILLLEHDILVFAGTVYSKVIVHRCKKEEPLHYLEGHRGVIFSIAFDASTKTIVTTSDDRSVRIWQPNHDVNASLSTVEYWEKVQIFCKYVLYGHTARVMKCIINPKCFMSVGEDAAICFWNTAGELLKRKYLHQNGPIWSIDSNGEFVVTGGSDGGVQLHPFTLMSEYGNHKIVDSKNNKPKIIAFTARGNIVMLCEENMLFYYEMETEHWQNVSQLNHKSTYKLMSLSTCKQIVAIADMTGQLDIFIENCKHTARLELLLNKKLEVGKILSLHWAGNRHLVLCCDGGEIFVITATVHGVDIYANFILPLCKERFLTASTIDTLNKVIVLGDRCGNIHFYKKGQRTPLKTFKKVHGNYGSTSLLMIQDEIISTGRDGSIKYFNIRSDDKLYITFMYEISVNFDWVEKFLDKNQSVICGFQERVFVLYDIKQREKILEIPCGGGHRSWDALKYYDKMGENYEKFVKFIYLKNMNIHVSTYQLNKIVSRSVISGTHTREINTLSIYQSSLKQNLKFLITGGEDTTLRISSVENVGDLLFSDLFTFKHMSSIRTTQIRNLNHNRLLLVSGGGRAHFCIRILHFTKILDKITLKTETVSNYLIKGSDKQRKRKGWREHSLDFDPETRIMSLDIIENENIFTIIAACSDAKLRLFEFSYKNVEESKFIHIGDLEYHKTCILKIHTMKFLNKQLAISMTSIGEIAFWNLTNKIDIDIKPFLVTKTNKAGINSFAINILDNNEMLLATGGDDNAIHLIVLKLRNINDLDSLYVSKKWETHDWHCAQITGLKFFNMYLISTSIDQRITLCKWSIEEDTILCHFISQCFTDISDVQGLDIVEESREGVRVCVFGKGIEIIDINVPS